VEELNLGGRNIPAGLAREAEQLHIGEVVASCSGRILVTTPKKYPKR
jgi:hypothetical protein